MCKSWNPEKFLFVVCQGSRKIKSGDSCVPGFTFGWAVMPLTDGKFVGGVGEFGFEHVEFLASHLIFKCRCQEGHWIH